MREPTPECPPEQMREWENSTSRGWAEVIDAWPWHQDYTNPSYWVKGGDCPRCLHSMTIDLDGAAALRYARQDESGSWMQAWCNCSAKPCHVEGRPSDDENGCGINGWVAMPPELADEIAR